MNSFNICLLGLQPIQRTIVYGLCSLSKRRENVYSVSESDDVSLAEVVLVDTHDQEVISNWSQLVEILGGKPCLFIGDRPLDKADYWVKRSSIATDLLPTLDRVIADREDVVSDEVPASIATPEVQAVTPIAVPAALPAATVATAPTAPTSLQSSAKEVLPTQLIASDDKDNAEIIKQSEHAVDPEIDAPVLSQAVVEPVVDEPEATVIASPDTQSASSETKAADDSQPIASDPRDNAADTPIAPEVSSPVVASEVASAVPASTGMLGLSVLASQSLGSRPSTSATTSAHKPDIESTNSAHKTNIESTTPATQSDSNNQETIVEPAQQTAPDSFVQAASVDSEPSEKVLPPVGQRAFAPSPASAAPVPESEPVPVYEKSPSTTVDAPPVNGAQQPSRTAVADSEWTRAGDHSLPVEPAQESVKTQPAMAPEVAPFSPPAANSENPPQFAEESTVAGDASVSDNAVENPVYQRPEPARFEPPALDNAAFTESPVPPAQSDFSTPASSRISSPESFPGLERDQKPIERERPLERPQPVDTVMAAKLAISEAHELDASSVSPEPSIAQKMAQKPVVTAGSPSARPAGSELPEVSVPQPQSSPVDVPVDAPQHAHAQPAASQVAPPAVPEPVQPPAQKPASSMASAAAKLIAAAAPVMARPIGKKSADAKTAGADKKKPGIASENDASSAQSPANANAEQEDSGDSNQDHRQVRHAMPKVNTGPITAPAPAAEIELPATVEADAAAEDDYQGPRILICDDSKIVWTQLKGCLEGVDAKLDFTETAEDALDYCRSRKYSLVFMDVMLPGMDGYHACKAIKTSAATRDTPVVMLTSKDSPANKVRGVMSGCDYYLTKPVNHQEVHAVVTRLGKS